MSLAAAWLLRLASGTGATLLLLGIVQGATEFLPISSSGHLVLVREWAGMDGPGGLTREIALHFGTLVAVVIFCFADLRAMLRRGSAGLWRLVVGSALVTALLGLLLRDVIAGPLNNARGAGAGLLMTTLLLVFAAPKTDARQERRLDQGTFLDGVLLGCFQSLALVPGVSRAGATIVAALVLGYRRPEAVRIAFLMSIPVVFGAVVLELLVAEGPAVSFEPSMLAATAVACLVGLLALRFISVRVDAGSLRWFGIYTGVLGLTAILSA